MNCRLTISTSVTADIADFDMSDFFDEAKYDGVDDNVEILLEEPTEDPNQAYVYIRIKALPDEEVLMKRCVNNKDGWLFTANTDMVTILSNGTEAQLAMIFLELFQMNPCFMEAVMVAINTMQHYGARDKDNGTAY